jgi:uncharacterized protein involved in propanediol utilization
MEISSRCPGTFGELVQGRFANRNFLITSPINLFSSVTTTYSPLADVGRTHGFEKADRFLRELEIYLDRRIPLSFAINSQIPRGKGLASSSADLIALGTCALTSIGIHPQFQKDIIAAVTKRVEPTDGIMYNGVVAFAQHEGVLLEAFPNIQYEIIGVILPGEVDTVGYDSKSIPYSQDEEREFENLFESVRSGSRDQDFTRIVRATTRSAIINQKYLPKPCFKEILNLAESFGAGVVVAHSGTAIGLIAECFNESDRQTIINRLQFVSRVTPRTFSFYGNGPEVTAKIANETQPYLHIVGREAKPPLRSSIAGTYLEGAEVFYDDDGRPTGLAIDFDAGISKLAQACHWLRAYYKHVEIRTSEVV